VLSTLLLAIPAVARLASRELGVDATVGQSVLTVLLSASILPARRRLRPRVERFLFPEREALQSQAAALLRELVARDDGTAVLVMARRKLEALLHPVRCVLYVRSGATYVAEGLPADRAAAAAIDVIDPLVTALERTDRLIDLQAHGRAGLGP